MTLKQMRILMLSMVLSWTAFTIGFYVLSDYSDDLGFVYNIPRFPKPRWMNGQPSLETDRLGLAVEQNRKLKKADMAKNRIVSNGKSSNSSDINNNHNKAVINIGVLMIACNRTLLAKISLERLLNVRSLTREKFTQRLAQMIAQKTKYKGLNVTKIGNDWREMLRLPIVVSQDCGHVMTSKVLQQYVHEEPEQVEEMPAKKSFKNNAKKGKMDYAVPDLTDDNSEGVQALLQYPESLQSVPNLSRSQRKLEGYYRIARHYRWAINQTFHQNPQLDMLILVEDDLQISLDFFEYFLTMAPVLRDDPTLYCVSAWNDNGKPSLVDQDQRSLLFRTDFFPGLGWMMTRKLWNEELYDRWPLAFWDDWLREPAQRKERQCVRPELSRTSTNGKKGVSNGQYYFQHLIYIRHATGYFQFYDHREELTKSLLMANLTADSIRRNAVTPPKRKPGKHQKQPPPPTPEPPNYEQRFWRQTYKDSVEIHPIRLKMITDRATLMKQWQQKRSKAKKVDKTEKQPPASFRMTYYTRKEFKDITSMFGLMSDLKNGVPRTAYKGIVTCSFRGYRIYLAPPESRLLYLPDWI